MESGKTKKGNGISPSPFLLKLLLHYMPRKPPEKSRKSLDLLSFRFSSFLSEFCFGGAPAWLASTMILTTPVSRIPRLIINELIAYLFYKLNISTTLHYEILISIASFFNSSFLANAIFKIPFSYFASMAFSFASSGKVKLL